MSYNQITAEKVEGGYNLLHDEWGPFPFNPVPPEFVDVLEEGRPYADPEDEAFAAGVANAVQEANNE